MATPSMQHYKQQKKVLKHLSKLTKEHFRSVVWGTVWEGHWDKYNSLTINCFNPHIVKRLVKEIEHYNDRHNESNINYYVGGNKVWMKANSWECCSYCDASSNEVIIHEILHADLSPEDTEMMLDEGIGYYCKKCDWHGGQY